TKPSPAPSATRVPAINTISGMLKTLSRITHLTGLDAVSRCKDGGRVEPSISDLIAAGGAPRLQRFGRAEFTREHVQSRPEQFAWRTLVHHGSQTKNYC